MISKEFKLKRGQHNYTFNELSYLGNGILFYQIKGKDANLQGKILKLN